MSRAFVDESRRRIPVATCHHGMSEAGETKWDSRTEPVVPLAGRDAQSSGILIQPWRMAYTTAWVRSLTLSLRRMDDMWFLTVCSLIPRA